MREALWLEELHAQVGEDGRFEELDELVDLDEGVDCHLHVCEGLQEVVSLLVGLCEKTEGECGDRVTTPGFEEDGEERLTFFGRVELT